MNNFIEIARSSYAFDEKVFMNDFRWKILMELYERNFLNPINPDYNRLPKKIHQIWLGSSLPEKYKKFTDSWKTYNPDWEYRLWTDADLDGIDITNRSLFNSISNLGQKSDYLRYHILNQFGGIYVDTDFECLKSFDSLSYVDFLVGVGYATQLEIYIGLIASVPHHPITELLVSSMSRIGLRNVKTVFNTTGTYFFTRIFFKVVSEYMEGIVVLPTDYLYPFPNKAGHENKTGLRYIKDCSYAVHHWAVSWSKRQDWIQGEKFKDLADYTYSPKIKSPDDYDNLPSTIEWTSLKDGVIIYTHISYAKQLLGILKNFDKKFTLITHSCDSSIGDGKIVKTVNGKVVSVDNYILPDNLIKWYSKNVDTVNPRIESIPIGLENDRWYASLKKKEKMLDGLNHTKKIRNLAYLNINVTTNPAKRNILYTLFDKKPWVTVESGKNGYGFDKYLDNLCNHKYVFCPAGNGMDTHRFWETLYMSAVPIVKKDINNWFYNDMPVLYVNEWEDVTEELLNDMWDKYRDGVWNKEKLTFEYWKNKICGQ
jgi:hypothetical protein